MAVVKFLSPDRPDQKFPGGYFGDVVDLGSRKRWMNTLRRTERDKNTNKTKTEINTRMPCLSLYSIYHTLSRRRSSIPSTHIRIH